MNQSQRRLAEGALYTDQYQLTMAQLYFRMGLHETRAQFDHFFRKYPDYGSHQAGYCISAGLEWLLDWMGEARFRPEEIACLRGQTGRCGDRVFTDDFLEWLAREGNFDGVSIRAVAEGRVAHPNVPLTVVEGPLAIVQIMETPLLNQLNFQTLVATKAARIHASARGRPLIEFGLRRAQDRGSSAAVRAALIGGADFSSAVGISHVLGYPPKGTHAHSMVQVFMALGEGELGAFRAYADVYPDDCLLLVDTVNTLESGVPNAIRVFEELRRKGHKPLGIRLDSGDLAHLAIQAARMLDAAGFPDTGIVLSNALDELVIWQILAQIEEEAARYGVDADRLIGRLTFGVGTRLITSKGASALDGVYKLVAVQRGGGWVPAIKISETAEKTLNPGNKSVWRLYDRRGKATADVLGLESEDPRQMGDIPLRHPVDGSMRRSLPAADIPEIEPLHEEVLREGRLVRDLPTLDEIRRRRSADLERLDPGVKRLVNPHVYHVSLTQALWARKQEMVAAVGASVEKTSTRASGELR